MNFRFSEHVPPSSQPSAAILVNVHSSGGVAANGVFAS